MENELAEGEQFRKYYNDLYFYTECRADVEMVSKLGLRNNLTGFSNLVSHYKLSEDTMQVLNDGMMMSNCSAFYRKRGGTPHGTRHFINECLTFPSLNVFSYSMNWRHKANADFLTYTPVWECMTNPLSWAIEEPSTRYSLLSPSDQSTYNSLFTGGGKKRPKSLSEIYSLQTFRKEFPPLPPIVSKKIKIVAVEGLMLGARDILGQGGEELKDVEGSSLDLQGALINNPSQNRRMIAEILANTVQKGYYDALIGIDVSKFEVEEYRDALGDLDELCNEVGRELENAN
jgi:hypothetical protein